MEDKYKEAIQYYEPIVKKSGDKVCLFQQETADLEAQNGCMLLLPGVMMTGR